MDTEKCSALLWILETGSLSAAAEKLGYTPSGVSRMMASMEGETGFPLLVRSRSGVTPTEECRKLLPTVRELAHWGEVYDQQTAEVCGVQRGQIVVGTAYVAYYDALSKLVAAFNQAYPQIRAHIIEGASSELSRAVEEKRADFVIISRREGNFEWLPLRDDPLVVMLPDSHPLATAESYPVERLAQDPYIETMVARETDNSLMLDRFRLHPDIRYTTTSYQATASMVSAGLGVAVSNHIVLESMRNDLVIKPLTPPQIIPMGAAYSTVESITPAAKRFVEMAKKELR
jgi:DNA-binding transcriptional LysR family regulator